MAKVNDYKEFEKGKYEVDSVEFFSKDQNGRPIFKSVEGRGGGTFLSAWFRTKDGDLDQPPGGISPHDLPLLVVAFGGDPSKLPDDLTSSEALEIAEDEINSSDKKVIVSVWEDGKWVNIRGVEGAYVPEGSYLLYRDSLKVVYKDDEGNPTWGTTNWGTMNTQVVLTIAGHADGTPCPYKGVSETMYLRADGYRFLQAMAPDVYENSLGAFGGELALMLEAASRNGGLIFAEKELPTGNNVTSKRPKWRLHTFKAWDGSVPQPPTTTLPAQDDHLQPLFTAISQAVAEDSGEKAFDKRGNLSKAGIEWAGTNLRPITDKHGVTNRFTEMDEETVNVYLRGLGREDLISSDTGEVPPPW